MTTKGKIRRGDEPVPSLLNHYRGHKGPILSLAFHPNTQTLFSSGADNYIMNWDFRRETRALRFEGHCKAVNDVNLSKDGDLMVSASDDCTVRVWVPIISGQYIVVKGHNSSVKSACFSPVDSTLFATASTDKTIKLWSVQSARMKSGATKFKSHHFVNSFTSHTNWIRSVRFSPDGRLLVSASDDKTIRVFDTRSKSKDSVSKMTCDIGCPLKADFNPCGNTYVGVSTTDQSFLMYDIRQMRLLQSYEKLLCGSVNSFAFHPSGDFAVCVAEDAKIKILDLIEGRPIFTLHGPRTALYATAFNPSGSLFATGGMDQEILIWEPILLPYSGTEINNTQECETEETDTSSRSRSSDKENLSSSSNSSSSSSKNKSRDISNSKTGVPLDKLSRSSSARSMSSN